MCRWGTYTDCRVLTSGGWKVKPVDRCIAPIVDALNAGGITTASSCCGHGKADGSILLYDGRELVIKATYGHLRSIDASQR